MKTRQTQTHNRNRAGASALVPFIFLLAAFVLTACSAGMKSSPREKAESASFGLMDSAVLAKDVSASAPEARPAPQAAGQPSPARKRITTGSLELQVTDLSASMAAIASEAAALDGYVSSSQIEPSWAQFVVRIPASGYDRLLSRLSSGGKVLRSFSQIEDVTEQWFDLDGRVRSKRILLERYLAYLQQAKNVEDLMKIERQVNDVTTEIEQLEGSFRMLENRIDYSTLTVTLSLPGSPETRGFDLGGALADFADNVAGFFMRFLVFILYFLVIGIPVAMFLALVWLLLFGRIGLARRLFALVSGRHVEQKPEA